MRVAITTQMENNKQIPKNTILTTFLTALALLITSCTNTNNNTLNNKKFEGTRALQHVEYQISLGPRTPGSTAHAQTVSWIEAELSRLEWNTEIQETLVMGHTIKNIIAWRGEGEPWIIIGAHYDSRLLADQDPITENQSLPVPGANDGASGVAVLLELARVIPEELNARIMFVFFDAEDNGGISGWDWILGSRAFADDLGTNPNSYPDAVIILDMIGDSNLNIYKEYNSDSILKAEIWQQAADLGYDEYFIPENKYHIYDDHTPFLELGIPAVDIIDFDYPYWHTTNDTLDKISAESLQIVGDTVFTWITSSTTDNRYDQ